MSRSRRWSAAYVGALSVAAALVLGRLGSQAYVVLLLVALPLGPLQFLAAVPAAALLPPATDPVVGTLLFAAVAGGNVRLLAALRAGRSPPPGGGAGVARRPGPPSDRGSRGRAAI